MAVERKSAKGCWIIKAPGGRIFIENSEIRALRKAVSMGAEVQFSRWGSDIINRNPENDEGYERLTESDDEYKKTTAQVSERLTESDDEA